MAADHTYKSGTLSKIWRKFALATAFTGVILTGSVATAQSQDNEGRDGQRSEQVDTPARLPVRTGPIDIKREMAFHRLIGRTLLAEAKENYATVAAGAQTGYSRQLAQLQEQLTERLEQSHNTLHNRVIVLDPRSYEVGRALGMTPYDAVEAMLKTQHAIASEGLIGHAASNISGWYMTRFGQVFTQVPASFINTTEAEPQACLLVPSSDYAIPFDLPGMTAAQRVSFINRHESWHCLDTVYSFRGLDTKEMEEAMKAPIPGLASPSLRQYYALGYKQEALSDVGAIGDMIRQEGMGLGLVDSIALWRDRSPTDTKHLSTPVLKELKRQITAMGIENFRKLDDTKAAEMYFAVTEKAALNAETIPFLIYLAQAERVPGGRDVLNKTYGSNPEYRKAVDFVDHLKSLPAPVKAQPLKPGQQPPPLTEAEQATLKKIIAFNAGALLEDRAIQDSGRITPATLAAAYGKIQGEMARDLWQNPDDKVQPLLMAKLQQVFIHAVQTTDYVNANRAYGVEIVNLEPSLAKYRGLIFTPPKPAAGGFSGPGM